MSFSSRYSALDQQPSMYLALKIPNSDFQSQFSMSEIIQILPKFSLQSIKSGPQLILMTFFVSNFFSKLGVDVQKIFLSTKVLFPIQLTQGLMRKLLKNL